MHWLQLFITHTHTRLYKITKEKLRYFDIMGANLSLGKPVNDIPWHGKLVTLEFLRKHWSAEIDSFKIEPVMAETREGVFKEDGTPISVVQSNIDAARVTLDAESAAIAYQGQRKAEYPAIEDQLDTIYHSGVAGWKTTIKAIKDKYPKP